MLLVADLSGVSDQQPVLRAHLAETAPLHVSVGMELRVIL